MTQGKNRNLRLGLLAALGLFALALAYIIITQSGLLPGDTGDTAALTTADEAISGGQLGLAALPWAMFLLLATVVLGAIIAYGQYRSSRATTAQLRAADKASHELYLDEDRQRSD